MEGVPSSLRAVVTAQAASPSPASTDELTAEVVEYRKVNAQEPYIEYRVECSIGGVGDWHTWRRFREFVSLRDDIRRTVPAAQRPLPDKHFVRHATSEEVAIQRCEDLSEWLDGVLKDGGNAASSSPALLSFLGCATVEDVDRGRPSLHVRAIGSGLSTAETGDVVLFRTKATVPALQRAFTRSRWDHVGLLIFWSERGHICRAQDAGAHGGCGIVESDANGTHCYRLVHYEMDWHRQYDEIAFRPVLWPGRGTPEAIQTLQVWFDEVKGSRYELTLHKLFSGKSVKGDGATSGGSGAGDGRSECVFALPAMSRKHGERAASSSHTIVAPEDAGAGSSRSVPEACDPRGFFCSELVADAYQALGVLPPERPASGYWPVDFGEAAGGVPT